MRDPLDPPGPPTLSDPGAFARLDGFVKIGDFEGMSAAQGHEGWSPLVGLRMNVERITGSFVTSDKAVGSVQFDPIGVVKPLDTASPKTLKASLDGRKIPKVSIHVVTMLNGKPLVTTEIDLEDVNVSAYRVCQAVSATGQVQATDVAEFRFHKLTVTVHKTDAAGMSKGKVQESYTFGS